MKKEKENIDNCVRHVSNIIINSKELINSICCVNFGGKDERIEQFIEILEKDLSERKDVNQEKKYNILNMESVVNNPNAFYEAGKSDVTLIFITKNEVNGNQAMEWKRELEMNGANILGAIYFQ